MFFREILWNHRSSQHLCYEILLHRRSSIFSMDPAGVYIAREALSWDPEGEYLESRSFPGIHLHACPEWRIRYPGVIHGLGTGLLQALPPCHLD